MLIRTIADPVHEASAPTFFVIAKKRGDTRFINGTRDFGFHPTVESAIDCAVNLTRTDPLLHRKYAGYSTFAIAAHLHYDVPPIPR